MDPTDFLDSLTHIDERARAQLKLLFNWNPRELKLAKKGASHSRRTRDPLFYDKHLAGHLQLRQIRISPSISQRLLDRVDATLQSVDNERISLALEDVFKLDKARRAGAHQGKPMINEASVVKAYEATAKFVGEAASVLLLHPAASSWSTILEWSTNRLHSARAVPMEWVGGIPTADAIDNPLPIPADEEMYRDVVQNLADGQSIVRFMKHLQVLAIWEFKSLSVAVQNIFYLQRYNLDGFPRQTYRNEVGTCSTHRSIEDPTGPDIEDLTSELEDVPVIDLLPATRPPPPRLTKTGALIKIAAALADEHHHQVGSEGNGEGEPDMFSDEYIDTEEGCALHWVQQAWCEAVKHDATVVVFHSGNYEVVGLRHRGSQTLFISNIIEPPTQKEYGKLETGLYIMAIEDAFSRAKILDERQSLEKEREPTGDEGDDDERGQDGDDGNGRDGDEGDKSPPRKIARSERGGRGKSVPQKPRGRNTGAQRGRVRDGRVDKVLQLVGSRNIAAIFLRYGIYDTISPACFIRTHPSLYMHTQPSLPPSPEKLSYRPDEHVTLALISEYKDCATGVVHDAVLEVHTDDGKCQTRSAVVKFAFEEEQQARLANEYQAYERFASKGIQEVPVILGMYRDVDGGPRALIMTHEGSVLPTQRMAFVQALRKIHAAGILHNDIRRRNLLLSNSGEVTIIDFDRASRNPSPAAMAREIAELEQILGEL
ncbi:hypothetical protein BOTBODRAFT_171013 [Botryobasidium botryosum FD-172 SS1]|uniref:Protein kinase domain-containing protein n=1 Tax=Botryobasidium botryosum (strain FD-172 SS1) TaxID=930990 RepID=A0A067N5J5_BOTB1|nr:hypothetical protein BOTBODRAFT_171013 [Botryobasidium botryosum FD-172 SS1]